MGTLWWEHSSGIPAMGTLQSGENGGVNTVVGSLRREHSRGNKAVGSLQ